MQGEPGVAIRADPDAAIAIITRAAGRDAAFSALLKLCRGTEEKLMLARVMMAIAAIGSVVMVYTAAVSFEIKVLVSVLLGSMTFAAMVYSKLVRDRAQADLGRETQVYDEATASVLRGTDTFSALVPLAFFLAFVTLLVTLFKLGDLPLVQRGLFFTVAIILVQSTFEIGAIVRNRADAEPWVARYRAAGGIIPDPNHRAN